MSIDKDLEYAKRFCHPNAPGDTGLAGRLAIAYEAARAPVADQPKYEHIQPGDPLFDGAEEFKLHQEAQQPDERCYCGATDRAYCTFTKVHPLCNLGKVARQATPPDELLETLAMLEHEQWAQWAKTILLTEAISVERKARWVECFKPYHELTEEQKEHDRVWARKVLAYADRLPKRESIDAVLRNWVEKQSNDNTLALYNAALVYLGMKTVIPDFEEEP